MELFALLVWALIGGLVGVLIGRMRGREQAGATWGAIFGPIGWLIVLSGPDERPRCLKCKTVLIEGAQVCPACRNEIRGQKLEKNTLKCPRCGEVGWVQDMTPETLVVCAGCGLKFEAMANQKFD